MPDDSTKISSKSVFETHTAEYENWFDRNKPVYLSELELLKGVVPGKGPGLEIGVGTGKFASPLGTEFGVDPAGNMLAVAKEAGVAVVRAEGEHLPFKDGIFNYALIVVTICFVANPDSVVKEAKRVLADGGAVIVGIVDKKSPLGELYLAKKPRSKFYRQAKFFSVPEITKLLADNGFMDISVHQTLFGPLNSIKNVQKYRSGYGDGGFVAIVGHK